MAVTARDDAYVILAGQTLTIATANVLSNDEFAAPVQDVALETDEEAGPFGGTVLLGPLGFIYEPFAGFTGLDEFDYVFTDNANQTDGGTVHIHIVPVNVGQTTTLNLVALTAEEQIASTYVAFFGRAADSAGFHFWVDQFNIGGATQSPGVLFSNIASSFGISDEARILYPFLDNPSGANDTQIGDFLNSVYNNLFNRPSDPDGLAYWTGQIKATLAAGNFVGSVLVDIIGGAQNSGAGQDITTLISKVAVSLHYVDAQDLSLTEWTHEDDLAEAVNLLDPVTNAFQTVLVGMKNAEILVEFDS